jgi:hypothetical protein
VIRPGAALKQVDHLGVGELVEDPVELADGEKRLGRREAYDVIRLAAKRLDRLGRRNGCRKDEMLRLGGRRSGPPAPLRPWRSRRRR